jgi:hypothetical protein
MGFNIWDFDYGIWEVGVSFFVLSMILEKAIGGVRNGELKGED